MPREECDLNRRNWCSWKPRWAAWIWAHPGTVHLDVHSFPAVPGVWGDDKRAAFAQLVLLDNSPDYFSVEVWEGAQQLHLKKSPAALKRAGN